MGQAEMKSNVDSPSETGQGFRGADMSVGEVLRRTRIHYRQSLDDIERALRIRASLLEALENGDTSSLPGRAYAIGFVRSYAEYLGLDGDKMVGLYKRQSGSPASRPQFDFPAPVSESKLPPVWLIVVCMAVAVLIFTGWWISQNGTRDAISEIPHVPVVSTSSLAPDNMNDAAVSFTEESIEGVIAHTELDQGDVSVTAMANQAENASSQPRDRASAVSQDGIILQIQADSWVEIRDSQGNILVSRVLNTGDNYFVPDRPDLSMSLGNAGAVEVTVEGQNIGVLGGSGEILRNMPLDAKALMDKYASQIQEDIEE